MTLYTKALLYSLILHVSIAFFLFFSPTHHDSKQYVMKKSKGAKKIEIIQTHAVDSIEIDKEIERIKQLSLQRKNKERQEALLLKRQIETANKQKKQEELAVKKLKLEQEKLIKTQKAMLRAERQKVLALKKARLLEKKRLLSSKRKRKALDKKLALDKKEREEKAQRLAEEEKEKRMRLAEIKAKDEALLKEKKAQEQQLINAEVNRYKFLLINAISQNWILPSNVDYSLSCRFEIQLAASGEVLKVVLLKTSGDPVLDRSAQTAIYNASPLPVPKTPEAFESFKTVSLTVKPENVP